MDENQDTTVKPTLYILMRSDMKSMNAGKAMAQASHASNAFVHNVFKTRNDQGRQEGYGKYHVQLADEWALETDQGFGTVIVLDGFSEVAIRRAVEIAQATGLYSEMIHDPSYPVRDGSITHAIPLDTCAYVFGDRNNEIVKDIVGGFRLHP